MSSRNHQITYFRTSDMSLTSPMLTSKAPPPSLKVDLDALCGVCKAIFGGFSFHALALQTFSNYKYHSTSHGMKVSAGEGCNLCNLFLAAAGSTATHNSPDEMLTTFATGFLVYENAGIKVISLFLRQRLPNLGGKIEYPFIIMPIVSAFLVRSIRYT